VRPNNSQVSRNGNYVVVAFSAAGTGREQGVHVYDRSMTHLRQISPYGGRHFDTALDASGNDVWVGNDGSVKSIVLSSGVALSCSLPATPWSTAITAAEYRS
jgi:hypothetical protein